jgi:truncated hemoglobin YjbI
MINGSRNKRDISDHPDRNRLGIPFVDVKMTATNPALTIYDQLGGQAAVNAAVENFYSKVLADERVSHFFDGIDMDRQIAKQKAFLTFAFGGPNNYSGKDMRAGHAHLLALGLDDSHVDAIN